ncbi:hypothetical protein TNCV_4542741 [Trichonephila clavipes]|nr:hypothetical protein TNCV_4542741 [Trichonephila clavipes]
MDKASSTSSKSTATYLEKKESETGIKCITLRFCGGLKCFRFIKSSQRKTTFKNTERTFENFSTEME